MNYTDNFWCDNGIVRSFGCSHGAKKKRRDIALVPRTHSFVELNRNLIQMTDKKTDRREMDHGPTSEQHFRFKFLINFSEISGGNGDTFFPVFNFHFVRVQAAGCHFGWKFGGKKKITVLSNIDMLTC